MRAMVRALWLLACIWAHILRANFPMRPMTRVWHSAISILWFALGVIILGGAAGEKSMTALRSYRWPTLRVLWLMGCISAHILRRLLPMRPMTYVWHRGRGVACWREMREIYRQHGINLPIWR